ncbi:hypothetical protein ACFQT0_19700 [Hymenobacter humi]|uniref:Type II toxin-antitoxin system HicA family toxin n=1 Tax=Hymenobacter humi TaxID=1411620 RepID=A0ABW2U8W8_9BACT
MLAATTYSPTLRRSSSAWRNAPTCSTTASWPSLLAHLQQVGLKQGRAVHKHRIGQGQDVLL